MTPIESLNAFVDHEAILRLISNIIFDWDFFIYPTFPAFFFADLSSLIVINDVRKLPSKGAFSFLEADSQFVWYFNAHDMSVISI